MQQNKNTVLTNGEIGLWKFWLFEKIEEKERKETQHVISPVIIKIKIN